MSTCTTYSSSTKQNEKCYGNRKVAPEDALTPANITSKTDISPTHLTGFPQRLEFSKVKIRALEEQLRSAEVHIIVGSDDQQRRNRELVVDVINQRFKIKRMTEDLERQRILVKCERNKARVTEKLIHEVKQRSFLKTTFHAVRDFVRPRKS